MKKITQAVKTTHYIYYGKGATLVPGTVDVLHRKSNLNIT